MSKTQMVEIFGEGIEYEWAAINKKKADQIASGSMDEDDIDELLQENSEFSIQQDLTSLTLKVGGKITALSTDVLLGATRPVKKWPVKKLKHYFIVKELIVEGLLYKTKASSPFDLAKLEFFPHHYELGASGIVLPVTSVSYNGMDSQGSDYSYTDSILTLYSPSGELIQLDGVVDSVPPSPIRHIKRAFFFKDEGVYQRYIKHIETNLRPEIEEGLVDISDITMQKLNQGYEITFTGAEIDLSCLPVSELSWVADEIGKFKDRWIK